MKKVPLKKKRSHFSGHVESASVLDSGWPPEWCVSYTDMVMLLLTAFVLWYSLTALKIPPELLTLRGQTRITNPELIKKQLEAARSKNQNQRETIKIGTISTEQERAIKDFESLKEVAADLKDFVDQSNLQDYVDIKAGIDAVEVTPRTPILFAEGSAKLKRDAHDLLDRVVELIHAQPNFRILVEGHTDITPIDPFHRNTYPSNWELSTARAISVATYLIAKGLEPSAISVSGYGQEKPMFPNDSKDNLAMNRRVVLYISFSKEAKEALSKKPNAL